MKKLYYLVCAACIMAMTTACYGGKHHNTGETPASNTDSVRLIIKHPEAGKTRASEGTMLYSPSFLSYMNRDELPVFMSEVKTNDALTLPATEGYLEIAVFNNGLQYTYFYLKGGDAVTIDFNDLGYPEAQSSLSPDLTRQYNFESGIEGAYNESGLTPDAMGKTRSYASAAPQAYADFLANYKKALADAARSGTLDPVYLDYYTYRYKVEQNKVINSTSISQKYKTEYEPLPLDDSLTKFISYYNSPIAALTGGGRKYDEVAADRSIPPKSKKLILYYCLRLWNTPGYFYMGDKEIEICYETFLNATGDAEALEYLKKEFRYLRNVSGDISANELALSDTNGDKTTLEKVIAKHAGKVVYVDFWASWCSPCVGSMPAALRLREKYADRGVAFVYLGYKDAEEDWRQAIAKYDIDRLAENYLILNPGSTLFEQLQLIAIPRYMVFDKKGRLANANAPRPEGEEIKNMLDKLLGE